jgi:hypothetical protein
MVSLEIDILERPGADKLKSGIGLAMEYQHHRNSNWFSPKTPLNWGHATVDSSFVSFSV